MATTNLAEMKCVACRSDEPAMSEAQIYQLMPQIPQWRVTEIDGEKRLERVFTFKDFAQALAFTDKVGAIAEQENHHPMLITEWGKVTVYWWTHKIHGLHQNDFVMAARTDELYG
jgi:4a-hydroxytetrahydrobiopterin dehydratase